MNKSRAFLKRHMAIGALLVTLAAAGCGTDPQPDAAASPSASDSPTTAASPSPSPTPEASPIEDATEAAASYESCDDGDCDVSFSGSVAFPLTGADGEWTVEAAVEADGVRVSLTKPNGLGGGGGLLYEPGCALTIRADGGGGNTCEERPAPEPGGIVVHLSALNGDDATLQATLG